MEFTVHFQKGWRVGARSLRMVHVKAIDSAHAIKLAKKEFSEPGYRMVRVDHFEDDHLVIDY